MWTPQDAPVTPQKAAHHAAEVESEAQEHRRGGDPVEHGSGAEATDRVREAGSPPLLREEKREPRERQTQEGDHHQDVEEAVEAIETDNVPADRTPDVTHSFLRRFLARARGGPSTTAETTAAYGSRRIRTLPEAGPS